VKLSGFLTEILPLHRAAEQKKTASGYERHGVKNILMLWRCSLSRRVILCVSMNIEMLIHFDN